VITTELQAGLPVGLVLRIDPDAIVTITAVHPGCGSQAGHYMAVTGSAVVRLFMGLISCRPVSGTGRFHGYSGCSRS
jgi:hypothetical protein